MVLELTVPDFIHSFQQSGSYHDQKCLILEAIDKV